MRKIKRHNFRILNFAISIGSVVVISTVSAIGCGLAAAQYAEVRVTSIRPLLMSALDVGRSNGILVGPAADAIHQQFQSKSPIHVAVKVIKPLTDASCKRLEITTSQDGVVESGKRHQTKTFSYQVNFCKDGRFPEERFTN